MTVDWAAMPFSARNDFLTGRTQCSRFAMSVVSNNISSSATSKCECKSEMPKRSTCPCFSRTWRTSSRQAASPSPIGLMSAMWLNEFHCMVSITICCCMALLLFRRLTVQAGENLNGLGRSPRIELLSASAAIPGSAKQPRSPSLGWRRQINEPQPLVAIDRTLIRQLAEQGREQMLALAIQRDIGRREVWQQLFRLARPQGPQLHGADGYRRIQGAGVVPQRAHRHVAILRADIGAAQHDVVDLLRLLRRHPDHCRELDAFERARRGAGYADRMLGGYGIGNQARRVIVDPYADAWKILAGPAGRMLLEEMEQRRILDPLAPQTGADRVDRSLNGVVGRDPRLIGAARHQRRREQHHARTRNSNRYRHDFSFLNCSIDDQRRAPTQIGRA